MTATLSDPSTGPEAHGAAHAAKLLRMAEEIAAFFRAYPEERAVAGIAEHINQFWTGHMREEFLAAHADVPDRLSPALQRAMPLIRRARPGGATGR